MITRIAPSLLAAALLLACNNPVKVELKPSTVEMRAKGQRIALHATPLGRNNQPIPTQFCQWSSSDEKIATVKAEQKEHSTVASGHNEAIITAVADGRALARCTLGDIVAETPIVVRTIRKVTVDPENPVVKMVDEAEPLRIAVKAYDAEGKTVDGREIVIKCANENICRGDKKSGIWGAAAGESRATITVDDAQIEVMVKVVDARTAEGKPQIIKGPGNPMDAIERAYNAEHGIKPAKTAKKK